MQNSKFRHHSSEPIRFRLPLLSVKNAGIIERPKMSNRPAKHQVDQPLEAGQEVGNVKRGCYRRLLSEVLMMKAWGTKFDDLETVDLESAISEMKIASAGTGSYTLMVLASSSSPSFLSVRNSCTSFR